jgi:hypothetical protein
VKAIARTSSGASVSTVDLAKRPSPLDVALIMPDLTQALPPGFNLRPNSEPKAGR